MHPATPVQLEKSASVDSSTTTAEQAACKDAHCNPQICQTSRQPPLTLQLSSPGLNHELFGLLDHCCHSVSSRPFGNQRHLHAAHVFVDHTCDLCSGPAGEGFFLFGEVILVTWLIVTACKLLQIMLFMGDLSCHTADDLKITARI